MTSSLGIKRIIFGSGVKFICYPVRHMENSMRFSQRKGFLQVSDVIQTEKMNADLRNSIWNILELSLWRPHNFHKAAHASDSPKAYAFILSFWFDYLKLPIGDDLYIYSAFEIIEGKYFKWVWYEVYDFVEFVLNYFDNDDLNQALNEVLERELAGYRYVNGLITDITNPQEIEMLEEALADNDFPPVRIHLQAALEKLANLENPDYRNSIKESISAVEGMARIISGNDKATLGDALKIIEKQGKIHPALKDAYSKLYGYTSDEGGIRHAMLDEPNLTAADAKYFLLSCTSFINYLKSKL